MIELDLHSFSSEKKKNWKGTSERANILVAMSQPLTAVQLARRVSLKRQKCSFLLRRFASQSLVQCLTPNMARSRLFWLTALGKRHQDQLMKRARLDPVKYDVPMVNWQLYAQVCFNQRAAVVRNLTRPMQPAQLRKVAVLRDPDLKLSSNNVRDVIVFLRNKGIVRVACESPSGQLYELGEDGKHMQRLLIQADQRYLPCS